MRKRRVSGQDAVRILTKRFGFEFIKQKGSHIKLRKYSRSLGKITTIIPNHRELDYGTLRGILRLAKIEEKDFWNQFK